MGRGGADIAYSLSQGKNSQNKLILYKVHRILMLCVHIYICRMLCVYIYICSAQERSTCIQFPELPLAVCVVVSESYSILKQAREGTVDYPVAKDHSGH